MDERNAAREAVVEQLIQIGGFLVMMWVAKKVMQPDFSRALRMRGALTVKRIADVQSETWRRVAENAATTYNKARI